MGAWESSVALTLESWFRISLSKRNYYLEMGIQISILCNKEAIYLIIACLKIRKTQKRETTKSIIANQTKLSHRALLMIDSSCQSSSNWEWAGSIINYPKKDCKMTPITTTMLSTLILESRYLGTSFINHWVDAMGIRVLKVWAVVEVAYHRDSYFISLTHWILIKSIKIDKLWIIIPLYYCIRVVKMITFSKTLHQCQV